MTTKTDTEQQRADFEAWYREKYNSTLYCEARYEGWVEGRAALQSQVKNDTTLFCDLKTDEEKSTFFLTGRGYETGVIAQAIQNDVAMAYHRCSEYRKELEALQSQDREDVALAEIVREAAQIIAAISPEHAPGNIRWPIVDELEGFALQIDHARRIEGEGE